MSEKSNINITKKNFVTSLLVSLAVSLVVSAVYAFISLVLSFNGHQSIRLWDLMLFIKAVFPVVFIFFGGVSFIIAFALLQRFRIKK